MIIRLTKTFVAFLGKISDDVANKVHMQQFHAFFPKKMMFPEKFLLYERILTNYEKSTNTVIGTSVLKSVSMRNIFYVREKGQKKAVFETNCMKHLK